jgi:hypothetical protein
MADTKHASCLCGAVRWEIDGDLEWMSHCHCSRCRKAHGVAFATYVGGSLDRFRLDGAEHVVRWESSPGTFRCFCGGCGSVVPGDPWGEKMFFPAGNLTDDPGIRPAMHIFAASKAPWHAITDDLPRFDAYPPGIDVPVVADPPAREPSAHPRGSCLCGAVAYEVTGPAVRVANCHCGRCRRARSAAHASNLVVKADAVRFTRGESGLRRYKLPEARFYTQVFCGVCGGKLPRIDPDRGLAFVPMGSLDDDPGVRPEMHIFTDSKAPWFEITDDLVRHPEAPPPA